MKLVDYPTFLATVNADDLAMLTTFTVGVSVEAQADTALADSLFVQAQRLYGLGMLTNLHRVYQDDGAGNQVQSFTAVVSPAAAGYVANLSRERITLSRAVLP